MKHLLRNDRLVMSGDDMRYVVTDAVPVAGRIRLFDELSEKEVFLKLDDVRKGIASGEWVHERPGHTLPKTSPQVQKDPELAKKTKYALSIVQEIRRLVKTASITIRQATERVRANRKSGQAPGKFPSDATIYRLLERERNDLPLYTGDKNKGNRLPRRCQRVRQMVVSMAKAYFLQVDSRWTLRDLVLNINAVAVVENFIPSDDSISRTYVRNVVVEEFGPELDIERMDPRTANSLKSVVKAPITTSYLLERVEQDALHLPWRIVTPDGVSHRIHWLHAIDCESGLAVGWKLVVGSPNVTNTLQCIESILYSKADYFKAMGLSTEKDFFGTPMQLVLDNGPENKGERITKLAHLGIDVMHCKAHTPQEKPYIERLNRSLKEALQTLPGCTRFDDVDGERDPETLNDLPMTLAEIERWIVRWYLEDWANHKLKRLLMTTFTDPEARGRTPWTRWHHATHVRGQSVALPPSRQDWKKTMYQYESRTLSRKTGITYRGFSFIGKSMPRLLSLVGENPVDVLIDPDDFRHLFVLGPGEELFALVNAAVSETTPAYSFDQATQVLKDALENDKVGEAERLKFRHDVFTRSAHTPPKPVKGASKTNKPATSKDTSAKAKHSEAVKRAKKAPLATNAATNAAAQDTGTADFSDVETLPVIDRRSGDAG
jgi:putative transposase